MSRRHLSRSIVLQALYEWDFYKKKKDLLEIVDHDLAEFGEGLDEEYKEFILRLTKTIVDHQDDIDVILTKSAPDWPIEKIALVDRNILRIGIGELLFSNEGEVPPKVAINEAIEMAKSYGGPNAARFVNGVLGTIYREIKEAREPKKEEPSHGEGVSGA